MQYLLYKDHMLSKSKLHAIWIQKKWMPKVLYFEEPKGLIFFEIQISIAKFKSIFFLLLKISNIFGNRLHFSKYYHLKLIFSACKISDF